jgi:hypothetical protein
MQLHHVAKAKTSNVVNKRHQLTKLVVFYNLW